MGFWNNLLGTLAGTFSVKNRSTGSGVLLKPWENTTGGLHVRKADDSGDAPLRALQITLGGQMRLSLEGPWVMENETDGGIVIRDGDNANDEKLKCSELIISGSGLTLGSTAVGSHQVMTSTSSSLLEFLTIAEQAVLGRVTGGGIAALTASQLFGIIDDVTRFKIGTFTHPLASTGDQSITGIGFQPSVVLFLASQAGVETLGVSIATGTAGYQTILKPNGLVYPATGMICQIYSSYGNGGYSTAWTFDSDGFTITWSSNGTSAGDGTIYYLAMR